MVHCIKCVPQNTGWFEKYKTISITQSKLLLIMILFYLLLNIIIIIPDNNMIIHFKNYELFWTSSHLMSWTWTWTSSLLKKKFPITAKYLYTNFTVPYICILKS